MKAAPLRVFNEEHDPEISGVVARSLGDFSRHGHIVVPAFEDDPAIDRLALAGIRAATYKCLCCTYFSVGEAWSPPEASTGDERGGRDIEWRVEVVAGMLIEDRIELGAEICGQSALDQNIDRVVLVAIKSPAEPAFASVFQYSQEQGWMLGPHNSQQLNRKERSSRSSAP